MNKKERVNLKQFCHYHNDVPAGFICDNCGRSICYYCLRNPTPPYQCPECFPEFWLKKKKNERLFCASPIIIIIILLSIIMIWSIFFVPPYEGYSHLSVENDDIITIPNLESYNLTGNNEIDITLKVYITNTGSKDSGDVKIELYVMKNGIVSTSETSDTSIIKEDKTKVLEINTTIIIGEYELQLMIWEDDIVTQKGVKGIKVTSGDVSEISAFEIIDENEPEAKGEDAEFVGAASSIFPIVIVFIIIMIIIAWFIYKNRTKPPQMHYQQPINRNYPK